MSKEASFSDVKVGFSQFSPINTDAASSKGMNAGIPHRHTRTTLKDAYDDSIIA